MKYLNGKILIIIILVIAFISVQVISRTVFYAGTPRINTFFLTSLVNNARNFLASLGKKPGITADQKNSLKNFEQLPVTALKQIGTGVYAKDDSKNNVIYIRITKDVDYEERIIFFDDGRQVKIRVPKGMFK